MCLLKRKQPKAIRSDIGTKSRQKGLKRMGGRAERDNTSCVIPMEGSIDIRPPNPYTGGDTLLRSMKREFNRSDYYDNKGAAIGGT